MTLLGSRRPSVRELVLSYVVQRLSPETKAARGITDKPSGYIVDVVRAAWSSFAQMVSSVLGDNLWDNIFKSDPLSEYALVWRYVWSLGTISTVLDMVVPIWGTSKTYKVDDYNDTKFETDEHWFYINGILCDKRVAKLNCEQIALLFHRNVTWIANPTQGLYLDLVECIRGKVVDEPTEPARVAAKHVGEALKERKVVVIAHSQGTIIASNMLDLLRIEVAEGRLTQQQLAGLELYMFASCADTVDSQVGSDHIFIENFANQHDFVANLGSGAPKSTFVATRPGTNVPQMRLDGDLFVHHGASGHLINQHYLFHLRDDLENSTSNFVRDYNPPTAAGPVYFRANNATPRLYGYYDGALPTTSRLMTRAPP